MEDQESAASRGPERAPEPPAHDDFESRQSSAPSDAAGESGYPEKPSEGTPVGGTSGPVGERPREGRGYGRYRGRGGRGRRPPPPPRRSGSYDHPREDAPRDPEYREEDAPGRPEDYDEEKAPRSYEDAPEHDDVEPADVSPEGEGAPEATSEEYPDDVGEQRPPLREPDRGRDRPRDRGREPMGRREQPERRGERGRGGERRDDRYERERERPVYRTIRGQIDRVRHSLESVLRDLERVVQMLQQAEHEHSLGEAEIEKLREQVEDLQRGGGRSYDRHRRHDDSH